ncbi:MAG: hypothetical protein M3037_13740, partial [Gemmatimonadota bacterium]|nr:hypothetical protein [Gemmatimonadota bacterium]
MAHNESRRGHFGVRHAQTQPESGMVSAGCGWREAIIGVVSDVLRPGVSFLRTASASRAENRVPCRQLARYVERGIKPLRVDHVTRASRALFSRLFDWRDAVVNVR